MNLRVLYESLQAVILSFKSSPQWFVFFVLSQTITTRIRYRLSVKLVKQLYEIVYWTRIIKKPQKVEIVVCNSNRKSDDKLSGLKITKSLSKVSPTPLTIGLSTQLYTQYPHLEAELPKTNMISQRFVITRLLCLMCLCYLFSFVYVVNFLNLFYFSSKSAVLLLWDEIPKPSKKRGYIAFLKIFHFVFGCAVLTDTVSHNIVYYSCCVKCVNSKVILWS